jgi:hypothetical protein
MRLIEKKYADNICFCCTQQGRGKKYFLKVNTMYFFFFFFFLLSIANTLKRL